MNRPTKIALACAVGGAGVLLARRRSLKRSAKCGERSRLLAEARDLAASLTEAEKAALEEIAEALTTRGKGILAADESTSTVGKRLEKAGLVNDAETRRRYREVLLSNAELGKHLAGVILFVETLYQSHSDGRTFVEVLDQAGVLVGVKTDLGLEPLEGSPNETVTRGLDTLLERSRSYRRDGAHFAKWRNVLRIDAAKGLPTQRCVDLNAAQLALYAAISQKAGLVPIVEPEILIEGDHSPEEFAAVTERVLGVVYAALSEAGVHLEGTLLKPQMVMAGQAAPHKKCTPEQTVFLTLRALRRRVPPAVPGVVFLSGGQSEEEATVNLNLMNLTAAKQPTKHPWSLSFSFGRSLQASVMEVWGGNDAQREAAVAIAGALARANGQAQLGEFDGPHPSVMGKKSLHDPNRGWRPAGDFSGTAEKNGVAARNGDATKNCVGTNGSSSNGAHTLDNNGASSAPS